MRRPRDQHERPCHDAPEEHVPEEGNHEQAPDDDQRSEEPRTDDHEEVTQPLKQTALANPPPERRALKAADLVLEPPVPPTEVTLDLLEISDPHLQMARAVRSAPTFFR